MPLNTNAELLSALGSLYCLLLSRGISRPTLVFHDIESWVEMRCLVPFSAGKDMVAGFCLELEVWPESRRWPVDMVEAANAKS